ncbi:MULTISPECIES: alternative ribosome rescue aminoacyl-tRNA hydrolase ArfB [unclassified Candidatus Sulfotelmatobacter]|jgi:ribosome-associated protein|uniref:alternative ribosome rescue aminoacyl-tRNA hydrolase ArfB n=1 Tax=unclassified Candidatus Sulfotelmatobacter TaxID=2635724 RepID=UPI001682AC9D|nr:alternative ribosome rescue aminoacyl-tRNA hydrolase ArfB [Kocuria sp. cx-116]MBD2762482.1 aminoacyl-tRNA hydrolase [Kocuria sp. cx-116]
MNALTIAPGPGIPESLTIPAADLTEHFARSSGPGGQGVNTTDSKVQLSVDLARVSAFSASQQRRVLQNLGHRLSGTVLTVEASEHRAQIRNRALARQRLAELLRDALAPPPPARRATRRTRGSERRRLAGKHRRSEIKANRQRPAGE